MPSPRKPADAATIRLLVLDVDGVLTDGRLYFGARGEMLKAFHVRDGYGMRRLIESGVQIAILSGRRSAAVVARCRELGVRYVIQGAKDKFDALRKLCRRAGIGPDQCACVGDDVPDIPMMNAAGLAFAVRDAHASARAAADHVTESPGGLGAVREVCDLLLAAREQAQGTNTSVSRSRARRERASPT